MVIDNARRGRGRPIQHVIDRPSPAVQRSTPHRRIAHRSSVPVGVTATSIIAIRIARRRERSHGITQPSSCQPASQDEGPIVISRRCQNWRPRVVIARSCSVESR